MKPTFALLSLLMTLTALAEPAQSLIAGNFAFDSTLSQKQVADIGKQLLKDDQNFTSMTVVGSGPKEFALYFQYKTSKSPASSQEFSELFATKVKKLSNHHSTGRSVSGDVEVLK